MSADRVLVTFHTSEGQTSKIAGRVASRLHGRGVDADLTPVSVAPSPEGYDGVVVADPVRWARQSRRTRRYVRAHADTLSAVPSAFVQVSLAAQEQGGASDADLQRIAATATADLGWSPTTTARVAGALAYSQYGWLVRRLMVRVVRARGGDTDTSRDHEYTDWATVDAFADDFAGRLRER